MYDWRALAVKLTAFNTELRALFCSVCWRKISPLHRVQFDRTGSIMWKEKASACVLSTDVVSSGQRTWYWRSALCRIAFISQRAHVRFATM